MTGTGNMRVRRHLLDMLHDAVPDDWIHLGHRCAAIANEGDEVTVSFDNGASVRADAVIGADGAGATRRWPTKTRWPTTPGSTADGRVEDLAGRVASRS